MCDGMMCMDLQEDFCAALCEEKAGGTGVVCVVAAVGVMCFLFWLIHH